MSLKSCLNLCSRRWLKPNCNLVNNFICTESLTLKVFLWMCLINFNNILRNRLYQVELRISGSKLFYSCMTFEIFRFARDHIDENFSLTVVNHKYRMVDQLKKLYRVSTIFSSIFFDKDIPVLSPATIFHDKQPLIAPIIGSTALCWTDSICLENHTLEGWS